MRPFFHCSLHSNSGSTASFCISHCPAFSCPAIIMSCIFRSCIFSPPPVMQWLLSVCSRLILHWRSLVDFQREWADMNCGRLVFDSVAEQRSQLCLHNARSALGRILTEVVGILHEAGSSIKSKETFHSINIPRETSAQRIRFIATSTINNIYLFVSQQCR